MTDQPNQPDASEPSRHIELDDDQATFQRRLEADRVAKQQRREDSVKTVESVSDLIRRFREKVERMDEPEVPDAVCDTCGGTKWETVMVEGVPRARRCEDCLRQDTVPASCPIEFREATLANYDALRGNEAAIRAARTFLGTTGADLYLCGSVGTGKTRLAASILNEYYRQTHRGAFARVPRLLHDLQPSTHPEEVRDAIWRGAITSPVLVLDDLGAERDTPTDFTRRTLFDLYEARGDAGVRTIFTSNKTLHELNEMLDDERLVSRIQHRSDVVTLTTEDQRFARKRR